MMMMMNLPRVMQSGLALYFRPNCFRLEKSCCSNTHAACSSSLQVSVQRRKAPYLNVTLAKDLNPRLGAAWLTRKRISLECNSSTATSPFHRLQVGWLWESCWMFSVFFFFLICKWHTAPQSWGEDTWGHIHEESGSASDSLLLPLSGSYKIFCSGLFWTLPKNSGFTLMEDSRSITARSDPKLLGEWLHFHWGRILCVFVSR